MRGCVRKMNHTRRNPMTTKLNCFLFCCILALGLAAPALAWQLNDSEEPGSVIVFHKFIRGTVFDIQSGQTLPRSQFEINITCPKGATCDVFQSVRLRAHWVCPPDTNSAKCAETNF